MGARPTRALTAGRRWFRRIVIARLDDRSWRSNAGLSCAVLGLMLFMVRVVGAGWPGRFAIFFPDSFSFKNAARLTPFSPEFYAAERPIGYPTLLFLLGRSTVLTVVVQTFLYGLAYLLAGLVAWRLLTNTLSRVVCVYLVVAIGLEPRFALWNAHILSESLSQTTALLSVAAWWRFSAVPTTRRLHLAGAATVGWLVVRDSNVPPWVAVGIPALLVASWWWRSAGWPLRRAMRWWGALTLVLCVGIALTQAANGRNRYPTMNNIGTRVLDNPAIADEAERADRRDMTSWFVDQGMPLDDALESRAGQSSFDGNWDMLTSPELREFRAWAEGPGQRAMVLSYIRFAPHWIGNLREDLPILLAADQSTYDAFGVAARLPTPPPWQLGGPDTPRGLLVWTLVAATGLALAAWRGRGRQAIVLALLVASGFVDLYMAYVGDSVEVQRHMVGPLARLSVILVLCSVQVLETLVELAASARRRPATHAASDAAADAATDVEPLELEPA